MYELRKRNIQKLLEQNECTCFLFTNSVDVEYLCGFRSSNVAVIVTKTGYTLFSDFRYQSAAEFFLKRNKEWNFVLVNGSILGSLGRYLKPGNIVGFQSDTMTVDSFGTLKRNCKKVVFKPVSDQITNIFTVKTKVEITAMRKAAQIADVCFARLLKEISPGMTERQVACRLDMLFLEMGAEGPSFDTIVLSGTRSSLPHGRPDGAILKKGKFVLFDFGCRYKGFCSDMTRTIVFGKATARMKNIYETVLQAQRAACSSAKAGMYTDELDKVARTYIESNGFGNNFGHALGHGVGLRIHENPRISSQNHAELLENSIVTIEPGIYIRGFGGVRIEDMVLVRKNDIEILTKTSKELIEL